MVDKYALYYGFDKISNYSYFHSTIQMSDFKIPENLKLPGKITTKVSDKITEI